jgi:DNA invertase Pin-like site-specific DNA recombinase
MIARETLRRQVVTVSRILIAARLSQTRQGQTGIETQDGETRRKFEAEGHTIVAVVADRKSGTVQPWDRPHLRLWVRDPDKLMQYDAIAGYRFDRLSRGDNQSTNEIEDWAYQNHKQLLTEDGLIFPCEGVNGIRWDLAKRLAHEEWLKISERYRRMQRHLKTSGYLVGRPPYGYRVAESGEHKTLEPDLVTGPIVREMARRYLAGQSCQAICDWLSERGIPTPGKSTKANGRAKWTPKNVSQILRNPAIAGRRAERQYGNPGTRYGKTILRIEPLVSLEDFERIGARMDARTNRKGISPANVQLLTGVLFCPLCEGPMYSIKSGAEPNRQRYYYCRSRKDCKNLLPVDEMDARTNTSVLENYGDFPEYELRIVPGEHHQDEIDQLRQDGAELDMTDDDYIEKAARLSKEIKRLQSLSVKPDQIKRVETGQTLADVWEGKTTAQRRDWLVENQWRIFAGPRQPDGFIPVIIDAGDFVSEHPQGFEEQIAALGGPTIEEMTGKETS